MNVRRYKWILPLVVILFLAISCQTDPDGAGGKDDVQKFLGQWSVSDQPARLNYYVTIERDPVYEDQIYLNNFADAGDKAIGIVVGNRIVIDKQEIGSGYKASGEGEYINSKSLKFEFILDDGIDNDPRKADFSK